MADIEFGNYECKENGINGFNGKYYCSKIDIKYTSNTITTVASAIINEGEYPGVKNVNSMKHGLIKVIYPKEIEWTFYRTSMKGIRGKYVSPFKEHLIFRVTHLSEYRQQDYGNMLAFKKDT